VLVTIERAGTVVFDRFYVLMFRRRFFSLYREKSTPFLLYSRYDAFFFSQYSD